MRELRQARGLSLRQLSALAYVSKSQLSEYETGRRRPSLDLAETLDQALGGPSALALGAPDLASQTHGFRGALERRKANPRGIARWFMAAYETPGISDLHKVDAAYKATHGLGLLGDHRGAADLLNKADDLTTALPDDASSPVAYWLNPSWLRLSGGLAHLGIGNHQRAAESLRAGLDAMPSGWQAAGWNDEHLDALTAAESGSEARSRRAHGVGPRVSDQALCGAVSPAL